MSLKEKRISELHQKIEENKARMVEMHKRHEAGVSDEDLLEFEKELFAIERKGLALQKSLKEAEERDYDKIHLESKRDKVNRFFRENPLELAEVDSSDEKAL
jgi:type II secretory pathway component PulF